MINIHVKEYEDFIKDYEDSQKHIKLLIDINMSDDLKYESQDLIINNIKKSKKFIPKIQEVKRKKLNKKENLF